jgi:hypothetical protein
MLVLACGLALLTRPALAQSLEFGVKATYLYKFAPFVEWPAAAFTGPSSPFQICVAIADPFGDLLDRAVAGQRIGERPIVVRRIDTIRPGACHVLYIGGADASTSAGLLEAVRGTPVLTVTDGMRDAHAKGIVNFVIDANRVRFEIDAAQAVENRLSISSKLLSLAVAVRSR